MKVLITEFAFTRVDLQIDYRKQTRSRSLGIDDLSGGYEQM